MKPLLPPRSCVPAPLAKAGLPRQTSRDWRPTGALEAEHTAWLRLALRLARRGYGRTSPNPMVGAVLVKGGRVIGRGWHRRAGGPHAEIEAIGDAERHGHSPRGATLYVTLEPCSTPGRTPPCTQAIEAAGIRRVILGAIDPNPKHRGRAISLLKRAGVEVVHGLLAAQCARLNEGFHHWIVHQTPFVTVKAAMTLDGRIATADGESKWITGASARAYGMNLRRGADAILVGINTVLADDPSLTVRGADSAGRIPRAASKTRGREALGSMSPMGPRRIILDSRARTPLGAAVVSDEFAPRTTIVVGARAPAKRVAALAKRVSVLVAPERTLAASDRRPAIDLRWLLRALGAEAVTNLLVEGGGEVNGAFLLAGLAHRVAFFYAPRILGDRRARPAVAGAGAGRLSEIVTLEAVERRRLGPDWLLTARIHPR
jgi:diaminohydroxyphosphoribosylaminopyrimidine deaminase / 5-amino-6-(5-phosphoribosylamino)uracil reductase